MIDFLDGNDAVVQGALDAGCDFFAGYPITPATPILLSMMSQLPDRGGVAIQGEDEIASIGFCIGAAMSGKKALTATSGPGMSLYSENIGLAIMGEVPLVIVDVQRLGPATGSATKDASGDIQFVRWITSGGYPVIALSPSSVEDCYQLTREAFRLAWQFRTPVFIMSSKELAQTRVKVDRNRMTTLTAPSVKESIPASGNGKMVSYSNDHPVPPQPVGSPFLTRFTGSSHDESGQLTKSPAILASLHQHLMTKLDEKTCTFYEYHGPEVPRNLIVCYGVVARSARQAWQEAGDSDLGLLILKTLWPVPETLLSHYMKHADKIWVPEMNQEQYARELKMLARPGQEIIPITQVNSELIHPSLILNALREVSHV
ncbi:MAG: pyruvate flavodoxin/ferredoxin oxidoreductase [Bacteroidetes bacterium]|nr:pyruvate flavodoxin/ferredoxin oxidoreductase [Bacteroidota bacterium]